ncbi:hypothetical protein OY671_013115 [Metschnikowia pulcherrima]|nr:hypothetical protein OY671_013115 [Metschnikowia pulcherrima]
MNSLAAPYSVKIEQGENFRVELQGQSITTQAGPATGLYLQCILDGVSTRQVQ